MNPFEVLRMNKPPSGPQVTLYVAPTSDTNSGDKSTTFTPAVGDLIVVLVTVMTKGSTTVSDNQGGAYTASASCLKASSADLLQFFVRNSLVSSAVSHTVTSTQSASTGGGIAAFKVTGMASTGAAAVRQSGVQSNQTAGGTPTPTLPGAPLTKNPILSAAFTSAQVGFTQKAGYTEHFDTTFNNPATGWAAMSVNQGESALAIAWGAAVSSGSWGSIALELNGP
jgi:hypothetical protein